MSNVHRSDLHALIQSLSRTEKRYVKTYLLRHRDHADNQGVQLFDAVEAQVEYDEAAIRKRHAGKGFTKRLPEAKRELYRLILRAMREYRNEATAHHKIFAAFQDMQFLREHSLPVQAEERLQDAEYWIERIDDSSLRMLALRHRQTLDRVNIGPITPANVQSYSSRLEQAAARINEDVSMMVLSLKTSALVLEYGRAFGRGARPRTNDVADEIAAAEQDPPRSIRAFADLHETIAEYAYYYEGNAERARTADELLLALYNAHPVYEDRRVLERSTHLYGMLQRSILSNDFPTAQQQLIRLRSNFQEAAPKKGTSVWRQLLHRIVSSELLVHLAAGTLEEPSSRLRELTNEVEALEKIRPTVFGLISFFNLAIIAFFTGKNRDATRLLHRAMEYGTKRRSDIYMSSRMMLLMIHAEQEHWTLVASMVRSIKRSMSQFGTASADETAILSCMSRLAEFPSPRKRMQILRETKQELDKARSESAEQLRSDMYAFEAWLRHHIEKRSLLHTLRDKL